MSATVFVRRCLRPLLFAAMLAAPSIAAAQASAEAGMAKAHACTACHGANGVSTADNIPNLAGQKAAYIEAQLKAFKSGERKSALMNAIAPQLSDQDIKDLAAFWNGLPPGGGEAKSEVPHEFVETRLAFPAGYPDSFVHYTTINFPERKQVRRYLANKAALEAAKQGAAPPDGSVLLVEIHKAKLAADGKPVTGAGGVFEAEELTGFTAMGREAGWGEAIPELLRNEDWNYAVFAADKALRAGVNQASCLACHKPLDQDSYVFSLKALKEHAGKM